MSKLVKSPLDIYHTTGKFSFGFDQDFGYFVLVRDGHEARENFGFGITAFKEARKKIEDLSGKTFKEIRGG